MIVKALLAEAYARGLRLYVDDGRLRCLAPHGDIDPKLRARLVEHRQELLQVLSKRNEVATIDEPDVAPMSQVQQSFYYDHLLYPESSAFNMCFSVLIDGQLDLRALQTAVDAIVRRHTILRTTYHEHDGELIQNVHDSLSVDVEFVETPISIADAGMMSRPFDLQVGPPIRVRVCREGPMLHRLNLEIHHIACDAIALHVLIEELRLHYDAEIQQRPTLRTPMAGSYIEYTFRQKAYLDSAEHREAMDYWRQELSEPWKCPELGPADDPLAGHNLKRQAVELDSVLVSQIDCAAAAYGGTRFELLFTALFSAYAQQFQCDDIMIGMTCTGRTHPDDLRTVGCFTNLLPVRQCNLLGLSFEELGAHIRPRIRASLAYQDTPFSYLRRLLARNGTQTRGIDFTFTYVPTEPVPGDWRGLRLTEVRADAREAKAAVHLQLVGRRDGLVGSFHYMPSLTSAALVQSLCQLWVRRLSQVGTISPHQAGIALAKEMTI